VAREGSSQALSLGGGLLPGRERKERTTPTAFLVPTGHSWGGTYTAWVKLCCNRAVDSKNLPMPKDVRWRRVTLVALFILLLGVFRNLAPVLVCFVMLERSLGFVALEVVKRTPLKRKGAIGAVLAVLMLALGATIFLGVRRLLPIVQQVRDHGAGYVQELLHHPSVERLRALAGIEHEPLGHVVKQHLGTALVYATGTAHILLYLLIGFVLAVIYLFEREELHDWVDSIAQESLSGTLLRWFGYVADAIAVTMKMQAVVALVSAVITLPVLILLGLPHVPTLVLLLLVSGLVPVVGNMIAGTVLCYVAYTEKGAWAVGVFLGVTFVLHKVESYYLNPKLSAQHVKLPGLVLVVSLLLFEQLFGFAGLFLSFPALYAGSRIANEWSRADASSAPEGTQGTSGAGTASST